jgi:uncharacterized Rmd1/YagE family protein
VQSETSESRSGAEGDSIAVRASLLGDRIDTAKLERDNVLSNTPFAYRVGAMGVVVIFRYGVAVFCGLSAAEEEDVLRAIEPRLVRPISPRENEIAYVRIDPTKDDHIVPGGAIRLKAFTPEHVLVIADALSKSVSLAHDERQVAGALDLIEPLARRLAERGRTPESRNSILKHIGKTLLVQHRMTGRVAVIDRPDVAWDRPELDRLYSRLEDEYELKERAEGLTRKLAVISSTAQALTDIIDTRRALFLEAAIVILILVDIVFGLYKFAVP